jgi:hypothetical protein
LSLIRNEQLKLTATWLNTLASGIVIVGGFTPVAALVYGLGSTQRESWLVASIAVVCVGGGIGLLVFARRMLRRLTP